MKPSEAMEMLREIATLLHLPEDADLSTDLLPAVKKAVGRSETHPSKRGPDSAWNDPHNGHR